METLFRIWEKKVNNIKLETGDIFLTNSHSLQAKIICFLMKAPTLWHHLWRTITNSHQEVRFYHCGMVINDELIIEQEEKVRLANVGKIFKKDYVIYRKKGLTEQEKNRLVEIACADLGEGYDLGLYIGKALSWLTGLKFFQRIIQEKEKDICCTRVALWYLEVNEKFGKDNWNDVTTDTIDDFCSNSNEWEVIAIKVLQKKSERGV